MIPITIGMGLNKILLYKPGLSKDFLGVTLPMVREGLLSDTIGRSFYYFTN